MGDGLERRKSKITLTAKMRGQNPFTNPTHMKNTSSVRDTVDELVEMGDSGKRQGPKPFPPYMHSLSLV